MMTQFVECAKAGTHEEKGFKNTAYGMSKVGLSALTRIQQQDFDKVWFNIRFKSGKSDFSIQTPDTDCVANHVHPGYVKTDMNNHKVCSKIIMILCILNQSPIQLNILRAHSPSTRGHGPPSMQHSCHPIQTSGASTFGRIAVSRIGSPLPEDGLLQDCKF